MAENVFRLGQHLLCRLPTHAAKRRGFFLFVSVLKKIRTYERRVSGNTLASLRLEGSVCGHTSVPLFATSADIRSDQPLLLDIQARYLTAPPDHRRYEWLYLKGPWGPARAWLVWSENRKTLVGAAAAFPRQFCANGTIQPGWVLGDFCIHEQYRSLGPALTLQRRCLEDLSSDSGSLPLCYDFPSTSMMAIYKRLGIEASNQLVRFAKPLRADEIVGRHVKWAPAARVISSVANSILTLANPKPKQRCELISHTGLCGAEFTHLAPEAGGHRGIRVRRSAEYLNWRYRNNPHRRYEILTARRDGSLLGYVVFTESRQEATIADFSSIYETGVFESLIGGTVAIMQQRGVATVSVPLSATHRTRVLLERLGFHRRESRPIVALGGQPEQQSAFKTSEDQAWFLTDGDRES